LKTDLLVPRSDFPQDAPPVKTSEKLWGMLKRKERWGFSFKGILVIAGIALAAGSFMFFFIRPFLAVTQRTGSNILVVEGWVHLYGITAAVKEFNDGHYQRVFVTGGPVEGLGGYVNDFQTCASVGADELKAAGIPPGSLQMVPSRVMDRDRTYGSAVALRQWFREHDLHVDSINVLTEGAHARRTRLLFQEALGPHVKVGIISVANLDYDPGQWWRYSDGVRDVSSEALAYVYAKIFFWPRKAKTESGN
jgi:uncharacterized SAM-binding protein YcdF (DUF218 family)